MGGQCSWCRGWWGADPCSRPLALYPQRPWAQGYGVWGDACEAGGAGRVKGSDPQMTSGPGPCWVTGAPCGFPSGHPRQCQRATWNSASEAGPAPSLFLMPFVSISREPDNALCTPRGPAPPRVPSLLPTGPGRGSSPGSLLLRHAPLGYLVLQQACLSGGH